MAEPDKPLGDETEDKRPPMTRSSQTDKSTQKSDTDEIDDTSTDFGDDLSASAVAAACANKADGRPPSSSSSSNNERRKFRTLTFGRRYKSKSKDSAKKRKGPWNFKLNCCRLRKSLDTDIPEPTVNCNACVCTGYRRTEEHHLGAGIVFDASTPPSERRGYDRYRPDYSRFNPSEAKPQAVIDLARFNPKEYPTEDWDERARAQRAREIEEGIEPPPGYQPCTPPYSADFQLARLATAFHHLLSVSVVNRPAAESFPTGASSDSEYDHPVFEGTYAPRRVHTQVDYIHCLVPDLLEITNCTFYWGKMDRYEAEKLLENKPEGTFLLRDSAQEEYLFSVSFRRYGRSLHARIEQWNHKFSFDTHDPGVFASDAVCGLIEHYKDPSCCMFFEPMLTIPLHRTFAFPLQHLCRAVICRQSNYDGINELHLPKSLKGYLKEYHYKQRVRVRRFEAEQ